MARKLKQLIWCDIYRDGGSLSGKWIDDENNEWFLTLVINQWDHPNEVITYKLYNCQYNETKNHTRILKSSIECQEINNLIENWIEDSQINMTSLHNEIRNDNRIYDLLQELKEGNY